MKRGPKSSQDMQLAVVMEPDVPGAQPPVPPEELSPDEALEWRNLMARMGSDWFPPESWPLLVQLCRHICQCRWFGQCLQEVRAGCLGTIGLDVIDHVDQLSKLHDREGRAVQALMVKLRLTTQARMPEARLARQLRAELPDVMPWQSN